jgi:hypothetical protein
MERLTSVLTQTWHVIRHAHNHVNEFYYRHVQLSGSAVVYFVFFTAIYISTCPWILPRAGNLPGSEQFPGNLDPTLYMTPGWHQMLFVSRDIVLNWLPFILFYFVLLWLQVKCFYYVFPALAQRSGVGHSTRRTLRPRRRVAASTLPSNIPHNSSNNNNTGASLKD